MNGRHLKIFYLLTMQYPLGIPPHLRAQVDWVFLLRDNNKKNIERLHEYYAAFFPCYEIFEQVYYKLTENYGCMVINCNSRSSKIEDCVFRYRAQMHDNFTMCNQEFWDQSANINNDASVSNSIHINDLNSNSTKFKININQYEIHYIIIFYFLKTVLFLSQIKHHALFPTVLCYLRELHSDILCGSKLYSQQSKYNRFL